MRKPATAFVLAILATAGAAAEPAEFRADARHGGIYSGAGVPMLHGVKWKFQTGGPVLSSPAISAGTVYFGSADHTFYALDERTGVLRWKFATHGRISSSPAVADQRVYFGSYDGRFYALDASNGTLAWKFATGGERRFSAKHLHGAEPAAEVMPDPFAQVARGAGGSDAQQADAAEDEGHHGRVDAAVCGQPHAGDVAV